MAFTREDILSSKDGLLHDSSFLDSRNALLSTAVNEFDVEYVKALLSLGANPNLQAPWGDGLLHDLSHTYMSRRTLQGERILQTARALLEAGADPDLIGCNNLMAINIVKKQGAKEFEALLLEFGAKPEGSPFA